jgi:PAS domain S-box-containing protein
MSDLPPLTHLPDRFSDDTDLYRKVVEHIVDVVTIIDDEGLIAYQSLSVERILGYQPESMLGKDVASFIHPDDQENVATVIASILSGEMETNEAEFRFRHQCGDYRYLHSIAQLWDQTGVRGIIVSSHDITDRRESHAEIEKSNELLSKTFSVSQSLLSISLPGTGELLEVNQAWCETLGFRRDEVVGRTVVDLGTWGSVAKRDLIIADFNRLGGLRNYEATAYTRTGEEVLLLIDAQILTVADQERMLMSCVNVTASRKTESELRQSQKMEAVGQLTGGVAHDFNNLIGVTMGNAELLMDHIADRPEAMGFAEQIFEASKRGADLTHQLLSFSRRQTLAPETVQLAKHLRRLEPMLRTSVSENTRITVHAHDQQWSCRVDPGQLETALLNLALNARDAMPNGGELRFRLANLTIDADGVAIPSKYQGADLSPGDYVALAVEDSGAGMGASTQEHAFEPFFTTKETGKGTGLGLSMVFGFAKQSGGAIYLDSEVGVGTTVTLLLPRGAEVKQPAPRKVKKRGEFVGLTRGQNETLLIIEDNEPLRKLVKQTLEGIGYTVIEASGEEDLPYALRNAQQIDLLLCDVILEGRSRGPELARDVLAQYPDAALLYMTGYSPADVLSDNTSPVLSKPFSLEECCSAVRQALDAKQAL